MFVRPPPHAGRLSRLSLLLRAGRRGRAPRARAAASPARARRNGSSSGGSRRSGAARGCGRSARRGDVLDRAVCGQDALLVLAAEQRELDLLALVLVRVVLHRPQLAGTASNAGLPAVLLPGSGRRSIDRHVGSLEWGTSALNRVICTSSAHERGRVRRLPWRWPGLRIVDCARWVARLDRVPGP